MGVNLIASCGMTLPYVNIASESKNRAFRGPAVLPAAGATGCAFSPDGSKLAVAHNSTPYVTIYNTSDWTIARSELSLTSDQRCVAFVIAGAIIIRGSVRDINNDPASRKVRVYERSTGDLCASTASAPVTGDYEVKVYEGDVDYDVQFMAADGESLNDLFYARTRASAL